MIVTWMSIEGLEKVLRNLESLKRLPSSQQTKMVYDQIGMDCKKYWKNNIYSYFDARISMGLDNTGQLGKSLHSSIGRNRIVFSMGKIFSRSGIEYGRYLRQGTGMSVGRYWPPYDRRLKTGVHPGYDKTTRWDPWISNFRTETRRIASRRMNELVINWMGEHGW